MEITKKVKCNYCQSIIDNNGICKCGKVIMVNNIVTEGVAGRDYTDISKVLLNENA